MDSPTYDLAKYVERQLSPLVGNIDTFISYSSDFVKLIKDGKVEPQGFVISFDAASLFMKIPLNEAIQVTKQVTDPRTMKLKEVHGSAQPSLLSKVNSMSKSLGSHGLPSLIRTYEHLQGEV